MARLVTEVEEVTNALATVLDEAGIGLPQFEALRPPTEGREWLVQLGQCNVNVGLALCNLMRDGLTLRKKYPEESVNARP
ncbi:hypothetical protein [Streptomyces afghaniensis]|uniref:hypothetical protein n=1 Tax=Streptomyces afghaniensis TaxID=66865 RepID=UPI00278097B6|nr:hypothetical protein [Streptomyces afghaniensis]MDQ1016727.1 hypothetical protein [Streptomyces afghaniensis]